MSEKYYFGAHIAWKSPTEWSHGNFWIRYMDSGANLIVALKEAGKEVSQADDIGKVTVISFQEISREQFEALGLED